MHTVKIKMRKEQSIEQAEIIIDGSELTFKAGDLIIKRSGDFPFIVLQEIREELEQKNIFPLINGARKDVYPSGMTLPGYTAYVHRMGQPSLSNDLVDIFGDTDKIDLISTVAEQKQFRKVWSDIMRNK